MNSKNFFNGLAILASGLFASSISSFLEHFPLLGNVTGLARCFLAGLSAIVFVVAIFDLVRGKGVNKSKLDNLDNLFVVWVFVLTTKVTVHLNLFAN